MTASASPDTTVDDGPFTAATDNRPAHKASAATPRQHLDRAGTQRDDPGPVVETQAAGHTGGRDL
ncbi:hypothetical protein, partial [Kitasatospora purpeofusca]|uniref:hypothetical protein n=1 Tax=Kitasatospora purpeofusca TaxID=67352 RepID=UPI001FC98512